MKLICPRISHFDEQSLFAPYPCAGEMKLVSQNGGQKRYFFNLNSKNSTNIISPNIREVRFKLSNPVKDGSGVYTPANSTAKFALLT